MDGLTTVVVKNDADVVINCDLKFIVDGQPTALDRGNYPKGDSKTNTVPADAQNIEIIVRYEAFIDDWKTVFDETYADTSQWPNGQLTLTVTGPDGDVKVAKS